jgi:predicted ATP-dependent serine protease
MKGNIMENLKRLSEIEAKPIPRLLSGFDELDFIYGYSRFTRRTVWGMADGKISLWAGTSGIGKSRLAIEVAKSVALTGQKVLYIQTESELEDFAGWANDTSNLDSFYCSGEDRSDKIIELILHVQPTLVIIDSVNEIEDFNGNAKSSKLLIKGDGVHDGLKQTVKAVSKLNGGCHLILLAQLNQDCKTIKGGTSLPHLVDTALNLRPYTADSKSLFTVTVGVKHRQGRRDDHIYGVWMHEENGVRSCSDNRWCDEEWCKSKGCRTYTRAEMLCGVQNGGSLPGTVECSTESVPRQGLLSKMLHGVR